MDPRLRAAALTAVQHALLSVLGQAALQQGVDEIEADFEHTGSPRLSTQAKKAGLLYITAEDWREIPPRGRISALLLDYSGEGVEGELVAAAAAVMLDLARLEADGARDSDVARRQSPLWLTLAAQLKAMNLPQEALEAALIALNLAEEASPERLAIAEFTLEIARDSPTRDNLAICAAEVAVSHVVLADATPEARAGAFDASLRAIELLIHADRAAVKESGRRLAVCLRDRPWCRILAPLLISLALDDAALAQLKERATPPDWPERVTRADTEGWSSTLSRMLVEFGLAQEIDPARMALEPERPEAASLDLLAQELDHPAYRRAVPQHRSFMREAEFSNQVLVLAHETTHALSLIGVLGGVSCVLRSAMVTAAARAASLPSAKRDGTNLGMPAAGDARGLADIETLIETGLKLRALHDAWTPWLEGLAVFAETAADPALEESRINPVLSSLRNLVDVAAEDGKALRTGLEAHVAEFEAAVSRAMAEQGPERLSATVAWTAAGDPYLPGYLAVRAVVAAWRRTRGAALDASAAFVLLLHATRFALRSFVPALATPSERFAAEARDGMARFVARLAALDTADIETFLKAPARDEAGESIFWANGRPAPVKDRAALNAESEAYHASLVREALAPRRNDRQPGPPGRSDPLAEIASAALAQWWTTPEAESLVDEAAWFARFLFEQGCLLPIGRCDAPFAANCPPNGDPAYLAVQMRTTERLAGKDHPSYNTVALPVTAEEFDAIEATYRRTGEPRIKVTRVVDLGQVLSAELPDMHVFVFQYGEAELVRATNMGIDFAGAAASTGRPVEHLKAALGARLAVAGRAELAGATDMAAQGRRTLAWLDASTEWRAGGEPIPAAGWAAELRERAAKLADAAGQRAAQRDAAGALLLAVWPRAAQNRRLVDRSFRDLTEGGDRRALVRALLDTARRPIDHAWLDANAARAADVGFDVFEHSALGWDVRPAAASGGN